MRTIAGVTVPPGVRHVIGVDEAGRGPLAGPVAVAAVAFPCTCAFPRVFRDSKRLTPVRRAEVFAALKASAAAGEARWAVSLTGPARIDAAGIVGAVHEALARSLVRLALPPEECLVLLDGGLAASPAYLHQCALIKGDERAYPIALASIVAKETRDACMRRLARRYPAYGFEEHKGYGTRAHYAALYRHGPTPVHRKSFLRSPDIIFGK